MERSFMGRSWKSSLLVSRNGVFSQIILLMIRTTEFLGLSTQVYKWVPTNLLLGVTLRWTSIQQQKQQHLRFIRMTIKHYSIAKA